jgi:hypothetical protein
MWSPSTTTTTTTVEATTMMETARSDATSTEHSVLPGRHVPRDDADELVGISLERGCLEGMTPPIQAT